MIKFPLEFLLRYSVLVKKSLNTVIFFVVFCMFFIVIVVVLFFVLLLLLLHDHKTIIGSSVFQGAPYIKRAISVCDKLKNYLDRVNVVAPQVRGTFCIHQWNFYFSLLLLGP